MVSRQEASSETSSEEYDPQEQVKEEATTTVTAAPVTAASTKRSYECSFCKRGFTNAQALGGHMNIHRKDRAKAKQVTGNSSISSAKPNEEYMNPNYMGPISSEPMNYYPILEAQRNYSVYFQPSGPSSPRQRPQHQLPHGNYCYSGIQRHQSLCMNEELWGANLSLQIGSNHVDDNIELNADVSKEDELDLELRLGHDRY